MGARLEKSVGRRKRVEIRGGRGSGWHSLRVSDFL